MNIIYYQTKTQFENTGDALINNALIAELRKYGKLKCNCNKNIPNKFIIELGIKKEEMIICNSEILFSIRILIEGIKSLFNDNKVYIFSGLGHKWGGGFKEYVKTIISMVIYTIYRIFGIKIVKIGMSLGPFTNIMSKLEKYRSLLVNYYYVRDTKSIDFCREIGIKKAKLCPDLSWIYIDKSRKKNNVSNIITITLRESILNENDLKYKEKLINAVDYILNDICKKNKNIVVRFIYQVQRDKEFCFYCYEYFKNKYTCQFINEQVTLQNAKKYYGDSSFNISSRLHSLLLGYKYGALPLAVIDSNKHIKISQTFIDSDLGELIFDINNYNNKFYYTVIENLNYEFNKVTRIEKLKAYEVRKIIKNIFEEKGE